MSFADWKYVYLVNKLTPWGTVTVDRDIWVSAWRIYAVNDNQVEWINFTSNTVSGSYWVLGGITRNVDPILVPMTGWTDTKTWLANQKLTLVQAHDQMFDPSGTWTISGAVTFTKSMVVPVYATTVARDAWISTPSNGMIVYITALGILQQYIGGAWTSFATGTTVNADTTTAGKVEIATLAETTAGTNVWGSWASLVALPWDISSLYKIVNNGAVTISSATAWPSAVADNSSVSTGLIANQTIARLVITHWGTNSTWYLMISTDNSSFTPLYTYTSNTDITFMLQPWKYYKTRWVTTATGAGISVSTTLTYTI